MTSELTGILAPVLTPFDDSGTLVEERIAQSVEFTVECGCHAVIAAGTGVQETSVLTPAERRTVISETIDAVNGRVPVVAGVSYPAQTHTTDLVRHAESAGADAVLAMPPWGAEPTTEAVVRYFDGIDRKTELPILLYNNPGVTVDLSKETMARIARDVSGVEYVKESSRDWQKIAWLFERVHFEDVATVFATMDVLLPTLLTVGTGIITPAPLTVPSMQIYEAVQDGDIDRAVEIQRTFGDFPPGDLQAGLTPVCKAAMEIAGVPVGDPRPPYEGIPVDARDGIADWMADVGVPEMPT